MPYTPPAGDAVVLVMRQAYVAPAGDSVTLVIGADDDSLFSSGWDSAIFGGTMIAHRIRWLDVPGIAPVTTVGTPATWYYTRYLVPTGISTMAFANTHHIENKNRVLLQAGGKDVSAFGTTKIENQNKEYKLSGFSTMAMSTGHVLSRNPQVAAFGGMNAAAYGTPKVHSNKIQGAGAISSLAFGTQLVTLHTRFVLAVGFDKAPDFAANYSMVGVPNVRRNEINCFGIAPPPVSFRGHSVTRADRAVLRATAGDSMAFTKPTVVNTNIPATAGDQLAVGTPSVWPYIIRPTGKDFLTFPIRFTFAGIVLVEGVVVTSSKRQLVGWDSQTFGETAIDHNPKVVAPAGFDAHRSGFYSFTIRSGDTYPGVFRYAQLAFPGFNQMEFGTPLVEWTAPP